MVWGVTPCFSDSKSSIPRIMLITYVFLVLQVIYPFLVQLAEPWNRFIGASSFPKTHFKSSQTLGNIVRSRWDQLDYEPSASAFRITNQRCLGWDVVHIHCNRRRIFRKATHLNSCISSFLGIMRGLLKWFDWCFWRFAQLLVIQVKHRFTSLSVA